ncbi:MAG: malonyl-CoA decarboxylase [Acetobacteraceae bacterium]|nr:malonyl-CoA decarboxylase [Acetobacteraceae bacterium]
MATASPTATSSVTLQRRSWLERLWTTIADRGSAYADVPSSAVPPLDRARQLATALLGEKGEASGAAIARELQAVVKELEGADRVAFYSYLASGFLPDEKRLREAATAYLADANAETATQLADASEPPRQELLRRMNMSPGGTASLMAMRKELLGKLNEAPELKSLDSDLRHLFGSWFNRGFLQIRRIDWQTPAAVLEKIITYEAVHEIQGWEDLRRRLAPDRRCFGFFHPALPGEPLIFVEVALTRGLASAVQPLLTRDVPEEQQKADAANADTAIFYSISNCQDGLRGVSFGNFLIKQVVEELKTELPSLRQFSTLSPVPSFRRWLERRVKDHPDADPLTAEEEFALTAVAPTQREEKTGTALLLDLARSDEWWNNPALAEALREPLVRLCAGHLVASGSRSRGGDPVARFHLGNGARLERINWLGNTAPRGFRESFGIMVNYLYDPDSIEANHEVFVRDGYVVRSPAVDMLVAKLNVPDAKMSARGSGKARLLKS